MSFKLYLDNKGVGAHDVVPNEEHIVSLTKKIWDGMGWILGSFSRGGSSSSPYKWCPSTSGVWPFGGLGIRIGKNS